MKYIFVSGGVCSSLGKGVTAASIGALLEYHGYNIAMIKIDPYLNVDAGTMNPYQHGEIYVTDDGAETDLDLGNYARFTNSTIDKRNTITAGQIYHEVVQNERDGKYLGETVQVIPHVTDQIKKRIQVFEAARNRDFDGRTTNGNGRIIDIVLVEIGGTVGDIESIPFVEVVRQMKYELPHSDVLSVHVALLPRLVNGEIKTKPMQHSVKELREIGVQPDILICRCPTLLDKDTRNKIAQFTNVSGDCVFTAPDITRSIYELPGLYQQQHLDSIVLQQLALKPKHQGEKWWNSSIDNVLKAASTTITIGMVGKYIEHTDSYHSVEEALFHAGIAHKTVVNIERIDADKLFEQSVSGDTHSLQLTHCHGILVPGGFGNRGINGILSAIYYARTHQVPYLGLCWGMQLMAVEFARNVLGHDDAHSAELDSQTPTPVIDLLDGQQHGGSGGTMRLGVDKITLRTPEMIQMYGTKTIQERHRHRYELVSQWREQFDRHGLVTAAIHDQLGVAEALQWRKHPWGFGVQFHPEFKSRPTKPHPLFCHFIESALKTVGDGA